MSNKRSRKTQEKEESKTKKPRVEEPDEETEEEQKAVVPYVEAKSFVTYDNGTVVISDKDAWYEYWERFSKEEPNADNFIKEMMRQDLRMNGFHTWEFFMFDDIVSKFDFKLEKYGTTVNMAVYCTVLGKSTPLRVRPPPAAILHFTGPPFGNFHPNADPEKGQTDDLTKTKISAQFSYSCRDPDSLLKQSYKRWREFIEVLRRHGARAALANSEVAQNVKKRITKEKGRLNDQDLFEAFLAPPYGREIYRDTDKTDGDPYVITASNRAMRVVFPSEQETLKERPYRPYGDPVTVKILTDFHNNHKPKCKEGNPQLSYVHQDIDIYDVNGEYIKRKNRKENRAFDDEGKFIEASKRSTISNHTMCIPTLSFKWTEFKDLKNANFGMKFVLEQRPGICIWRPRAASNHPPSTLSYDSDDENAPIPTMLAFKQPDEMFDDSIDDALLVHDIPPVIQDGVTEGAKDVSDAPVITSTGVTESSQ